jgi:hypothetical protein
MQNIVPLQSACHHPHGALPTNAHYFRRDYGADRKLWVDFTPGSTNISYLRQALDAARQRSPIRFYGNAIGVIINYTPDDAVRFDLNGDAVEVLSGALPRRRVDGVAPGQTSFHGCACRYLLRAMMVNTDFPTHPSLPAYSEQTIQSSATRDTFVL